MINSIIRKRKKLVCNDIAFPPSNYEKNVLRSIFFYNKTKFKHKKWKFLRSWKFRLYDVLFKRFSPSLKYMPRYTRLISKFFDIDNIKINKFRQYLTYKSRLTLVTRLRGLFRFRTVKKLKKNFTYKHITTHFNTFDTNFEMLLLRLGIVTNIKTARVYVKNGILKINHNIRYQTNHLMNFDRVGFSKRETIILKVFSIFWYVTKKYRAMSYDMYLKMIDHMDLLCHEVSEFNRHHFLVALPFTSTFNFKNMKFVFFNFLLKNQWNYFFDFFTAKKFLQYAR